MASRGMSLAHWKILHQLREYINRASNEKSFQIAVNKELASLFQKFSPTVYGSEIIKYEGNDENSTKSEKENAAACTTVASPVETEQGYLPNVLNGLKNIKIGNKPENNEKKVDIKPKWKVTRYVSTATIASRTTHVLTSIALAETDESKLKRIEDLATHVEKFPEAKNAAVKEGAIRILLQVRSSTKNHEIHAAVAEAFAILGYNDPLPGRGIRILSIDGGGIRGLLVLDMLKKLEELTGMRVHEMFDFICGVSTGAIMSCAIAANQSDLEELKRYYKELGTKVFTQSPIWGTSSLVWSHSYYDTALWEQMLQGYLGHTSLIKTSRNPKCPKLAAVSTVVNQSKVSAYVFRNYSLPWRVRSQYMGGSNHKVWEAARASAAAPTYFEEFKLGNLLHQDGGIMVNNPTAVAIHEAKQLWPGVPLQCVVSFGTGRSIPLHPELEAEENTTSSSWKTKFMKILDSATDTEGVHTMLNDLLPNDVYFRFNPYLTEMVSMVEINPKKLEQLELDVIMYLRRNEDKFQEAAKALLKKKTSTQKALDWVNVKRETLGFSFK